MTLGGTAKPRQLCISNGDLWYWDAAIEEPRSQLFEQLQQTIQWQQHQVRVFGRSWPAPRLSAWYGDPAARYRYSGLELEPLSWTPVLSELRGLVESLTRCRFNSVLLNRYRDGQDGMGWHSDDEPELGSNPQIAALSFGAQRRFVMRRRDHHDDRIELTLADRSLLLMGASTQQYWQHSLPKTRRMTAERISLTFRLVSLPQPD